MGTPEAADDRIPFSTRLRDLRRAAGMTQQELADAAGVSVRTVSDLERSVRRTPQAESGVMLADALGLSDDGRARFLAAIRDQRLHHRPPAIARAPLPEPPAPILGRGREIAAVEARLAGGARVVTLAGPGGIGKTTVALEVARRRAAAGEPVAWAALETVDDPGGVLPAIARACGIDARPGLPLPRRIADAIAGRRLLLVLDNLEHLLAAAPEIAGLLELAPTLAILATTRETVRIAGEEVLPVDPLPVPAAGDVSAALAANPAVALFLRASGQRDPDPAALAAAGRVVTLLDGVPLAIELAAARAATVPAASLAVLLEQSGIEALSLGRRDGPARFASMEAAIAWSEERLPEPARRLLRLLAVFRGGFTAEAVAGVAGALGDPALAAGLLPLASAQLIRPAEGRPDRFALLEPVRMFALARLRAAGEEDAARRAHAAWFLDWANRQARILEGRDPLPGLDALEADLPNLLAARADPSAGAAALPAAVRLWPFWEHRGFQREGRLGLEAAIAAFDRSGAPPTGDLLWALFWAAYFANLLGDDAASRGWISRFEALAADIGPPGIRAYAVGLRWTCADARGLPRGDGEAILRRELDGLRSGAGALAAWPIALLLGAELHERGDLDAAVPLLREARALAAGEGGLISEVDILARLGAALADRGEAEEAAALLRESLAISARLGLVRPALVPLAVAAEAAEAAGDPERAARLLGAAEGLAERLDLPRDSWRGRRLAACRDRLAGALGDAALAALAAEGQDLPLPEAIALAAG